MEIRDEYIIILALLLLVITFYSLNNIFSFMPVINQCTPSFEIINECKCIPDNNLAKLFKQKDIFNLNYTELNENIKIPLK